MIDLEKVVIKEKKVDTILTKSNLPIAGYSIILMLVALLVVNIVMLHL